MLKSLPNTTLPIRGRVAFLVCAYAGRPAFSFANRFPQLRLLARILDRLTGYSLRQFIAANRDGAANPRTFAYQLGLVREVLAGGEVSEARFFIDSALNDPVVLEQFNALGRVEVRHPGSLAAKDWAGCEALAIIYPDALGLGWSKTEAELMRNVEIPLVFVNGRRRIMRLDAAARRSLLWRRGLANTRIVELGLTLLIVPLAMTWSVIDTLRGRS